MDVMIDIETLSTKNNASILTIGAIKFSRNNNLPDIENCSKFYRRISKDSCDIIGLHTDPNTIDWWNSQSEEAKHEIFTHENRISLKQALEEFSEWFSNSKCIWSNGSVFDITIMTNAYELCNIEPPWKFWNIRDVRTICDIGKVNLKNIPNHNHHNAISDCYIQIIGIKKALSNIHK